MQRTVLANTQPLTNLRQWFVSHGGWIHPALVAGPSPQYGCRGLLSVEDIPFEESGEQTVILLPKALRIGNAIAKDILAEKLSASSIQDLEAKSALNGVLLAYERNKKASLWSPYLASLPVHPSAGWYLKPVEAAQALQKLGLPGCKASVKATRQWHVDKAKTLTNRIGGALGVSASDILWGLATACCRGYRGPGEAFLMPVIDLCNHSGHAALVQGVLVDGKEFVRGRIQQLDGSSALQAGGEVVLNYGVAGEMSACEAFMDYGFVL